MEVQDKQELLKHSGRRLLLPEVDRLDEIAFDFGPWEYDARESYVPAQIGDTDNELSQFAWIDLSQTGGPKHTRRRLFPAQNVIEAIVPNIVTPDDHLSWKIISHKDSGLALVIIEHGYIIGSHWVAYIDPASIPVPS